MVKAFNAFQITVLFAAFPFIIQFIDKNDFYGHKAAFWVAVVSYLLTFYFNVVAWFALFEDK